VIGRMSQLEYWVNADDQISSVNDEWLSFAEANEGRGLLPPGILGRSLWEFMGDMETRHIYGLLHTRVRTRELPVRLCFRCDGPERRRLLQLDILPERDQELLYRVRTLKQEHRAAVPLLDPQQPRQESFVSMCGWCKRVAVAPRGWLEVEEAIAALALFAQPHPPQLTHGVCEECKESLSDALDGRQDDLVLGRL
jgi:hypothetical protein